MSYAFCPLESLHGLPAGGGAITAANVAGWLQEFTGYSTLSQLKLLCLRLVSEARSLQQLWGAERSIPVSTDQLLGSPERKHQQVGLCSRLPNWSLRPNMTLPFH